MTATIRTAIPLVAAMGLFCCATASATGQAYSDQAQISRTVVRVYDAEHGTACYIYMNEWSSAGNAMSCVRVK